MIFCILSVGQNVDYRFYRFYEFCVYIVYYTNADYGLIRIVYTIMYWPILRWNYLFFFFYVFNVFLISIKNKILKPIKNSKYDIHSPWQSI